MTTITNLEHTRGNTFVRVINITDSDDVAVNLTGSTITMTVRRKADDSNYIAQGTATLSDQTTDTGEATITLAATLFYVEPGQYVYDIKWVDSTGKITTHEKGAFAISFNVT